MTFDVRLNPGFKPPQIMDCFVSLPKVSVRQLCDANDIPYDKTLEDYDLQLDVVCDSSDTSSDGSDVEQSDYSDTSVSFEVPNLKKRNRKRKKLSQMYTNWSPTKRRKVEPISSQKSGKTHNKSINGLTEKSKKKSNKCTDNQSKSGSHSKRKQSPKPLKFVNNSGINSTQYLSQFEEFCLEDDIKQTKTKKSSKTTNEVINKRPNNSLNETLIQNNSFSSNKKSTKRKDRSAKGRANRGDPNRCIEFLGEKYIHSDIFDDFCQCEQNCELDELSMAFDLLMTSLEEELPKDLKIATNGLQYSDLLTSEEEVSDQNLDGFMPGVDDIYEQTIEEELFSGYINDFVKKTTLTPISNPTVIQSKPKAFTSNQLFNGHTSTAPSAQSNAIKEHSK